MKRTSLQRRRPISNARKAIERKTRLRPVNPKRTAKRRADQFGTQAKLCRNLPCCACGVAGPSDAHHLRSRAAGGQDRDTIPLCRLHHGELHQIGWLSFGEKYGLDYVALLEDIRKQAGENRG